MEVSNFTEKLNKVDGIIHTVEEEIIITNGVYEGILEHDNINKNSLNIYTGSKLTGDKITNYFISTPSETPWKNTIKIISNVSPVYISYETTGDQVEAEDINNLQDSIVAAQQEINSYEEFNNTRVSNAEIRITNVENDKADKDKVFTKEEVLQKISDLIGIAPDLINTFEEVANALGNNPNFAGTVMTLLSNKADKETGKSLISDLEWENIKAEVDNARGTFQNLDERLQNIDGSSSSDTLYTTSNVGNNYSVTIPNLATLTDGYPLTVKFNVASTGAITINPSSLGAINVVDYFGNQVTNVRKDLIANIRYDAANSNFQLLGKGGGGNILPGQALLGATFTADNGPGVGTIPSKGAATYSPATVAQTIAAGQYLSGIQTIAAITGTAALADVLATKTFNSANGINLTGSMINRGAVTNTIATAGGTYVIPVGYHNGSGVVTAPSLAAVTTAGTVTSASQIVSGYSAYSNGVLYNGTGASITLIAGSFFNLVTLPYTGSLSEPGTTYLSKFSRVVKNQGGVLRVTFPLYATAFGDTAYARIYVNGIPVGTERITTAQSSNAVTFTEDIPVNVNDTIAIYIRRTGTGSGWAVLNGITVSCGNNYGYLL